MRSRVDDLLERMAVLERELETELRQGNRDGATASRPARFVSSMTYMPRIPGSAGRSRAFFAKAIC